MYVTWTMDFKVDSMEEFERVTDALSELICEGMDCETDQCKMLGGYGRIANTLEELYPDDV